METVKPNKARGVIQIIMLSFFFIGLPLGSYYYLNKGYQYQKELMTNLMKEQMMPSLENWTLLSGIEPDSLKGSMHLITFLDTKDEANVRAFGGMFKNLHDQFDAPDNIDFMILMDSSDSSAVQSFLMEHDIFDEEQIRFYTAGRNQFEKTAEEFGLSAEQIGNLSKTPQLAMVDDSLYVRVVYQTNSAADIKILVEQVAVILPERNKPGARLQRETEK